MHLASYTGLATHLSVASRILEQPLKRLGRLLEDGNARVLRSLPETGVLASQGQPLATCELEIGGVIGGKAMCTADSKNSP